MKLLLITPSKLVFVSADLLIMFGKGKRKLTDKKSGRPKGSTPWNKGIKYRVIKGVRIKSSTT